MDYFTADLHLGHASIMKHSRRTEFMTEADRASLRAAIGDPHAYKAWKPSAESVECMDQGLLARINGRVSATDRLWIIGDFASPRKATVASMRAYRDAIRCRDVRLVWGNHDPRHLCDGLFTATYEAVRLIISARRTIVEADAFRTHAQRSLKDRLIAGKRARVVFLSHYAHVVWHHSDRGVYHLYGHSHGNLEAWRAEHMPSALALDVGVDCWGYEPLSFPQIDRLLSEKQKRVPPHTVDHAGRIG